MPINPLKNHNPNYKIFLWGSIILIAVNVCLFAYVNTIPIYWVQNETILHRFFWSMDDIHNFSLHLGLKKEDWIKPFVSYYIDGMFRPRLFSYLLEMLSFKFWQWWETGYTRNYALIGIHLVNTALLWFVTFYLKKNKRVSWVATLLFFNAGAVLTTLLFPFRNAKLLSITIFLISWLVLLKSKNGIEKISFPRLLTFFSVWIIGLLTDETFYFWCLILFMFILVQEGKRGLFNRKFIWGIIISLSIIVISINLSYHISFKIAPQAHYSSQLIFLKNLFGYFFHPSIFFDSLQALYFYFLRRNFGYWDQSIWGVLSFFSFLILLFLSLHRVNLRDGKICICILAAVGLKAVFLPIYSGVHDIIMPQGTVFPSLLFFSYYYVYGEAMFFALILALLLNMKKEDKTSYILTLALVTVLNISNVTHVKQNLKETLMFHDWGTPDRQAMVKRVAKVKPFLERKELFPLYLAFPSGEEPFVKGRIDDGIQFFTARVIPVMYLRSLKEGKAIISLQNVQPKHPFLYKQELLNARYFFDLGLWKLYDLEKLRIEKGREAFMPRRIIEPATVSHQELVKDASDVHVIYFVKGFAKMELDINGKNFPEEQLYGYSYQMFRVDMRVQKSLVMIKVQLLINPKSNSAVDIVGPFIVPTTERVVLMRK